MGKTSPYQCSWPCQQINNAKRHLNSNQNTPKNYFHMQFIFNKHINLPLPCGLDEQQTEVQLLHSQYEVEIYGILWN